MPHKRAKHSARVASRDALGHDLPPQYAPIASTRTDGDEKAATNKKRRPTRGQEAKRSDPHLHSVPKGAARIVNAIEVRRRFHERRQKQATAKMSTTSTTQQRQQQQQQQRTPRSSASLEGNSAKPTTAASHKVKGKQRAIDSDENAETTQPLRIRPGEKLRDFNARVERTFAPQLHALGKSQSRSAKRKRRAERESAAATFPSGAPDDRPPLKSRASTTAAGTGSSPLATGGGTAGGAAGGVVKSERAPRAEDFETAPQRRSVRDVVQEPPRLTKLPRGVAATSSAPASGGTASRLPEPVARPNGATTAETKARTTTETTVRRREELEEQRTFAVEAYRLAKARRIAMSEDVARATTGRIVAHTTV